MLEAHPFADLFPMLGADDSADLRADIAAYGLRDRVVIFEGRILDGRNRYRALQEIAKLGLAYHGRSLTAVDLVPGAPGNIFEKFAGTEAEALEYVLSKNLHRRHLDESQRAMVAANLAGLKPGRPSSDKPANLPVYRQAEAAERLHVSERSVRDAHVVRERGIDDINEAVQRGDLAVSAAAQLARLPADEQARIIRETADPKALSRVAKELRAEKQAEKAVKREAREAALGAKLAALPDKRYGVIIADPEWRYEVWSEDTGRDRSPDNHYPTSPLEDIIARPVADIAADDCVLFLWVTVPFLDAGLKVLAAWGFGYVTHIVWIKDRPGEARGTGYWFTGEHEVVLVGKRGAPPAPTPGTQFPSYFRAPVGEHSAKPDNVHEIAEAYFPNLPKIELNARRKRPGWDVWGLEADGGEDERSDHEAHDAQDGAQRAELAVNGAEAAAGGKGAAGSLGEGVSIPVAELASAEGPRSVGDHPPGPDSPQAELSGIPDAEVIAVIGEAVAAAIGNSASLRTGDSRLLSPEERLIRRQVLRIAFGFGLSFARIGAVLGGCKQGASRLRVAAIAEVEADQELAGKLAGVAADVLGRLGR